MVVAMTATDNVASQRVVERAGFTRLPEPVVDPEDGPLWRWELALGAEPE
jgi:RimJ/RimL family protein N-acetyltransferase